MECAATLWVILRVKLLTTALVRAADHDCQSTFRRQRKHKEIPRNISRIMTETAASALPESARTSWEHTRDRRVVLERPLYRRLWRFPSVALWVDQRLRAGAPSLTP